MVRVALTHRNVRSPRLRQIRGRVELRIGVARQGLLRALPAGRCVAADEQAEASHEIAVPPVAAVTAGFGGFEQFQSVIAAAPTQGINVPDSGFSGREVALLVLLSVRRFNCVR